MSTLSPEKTLDGDDAQARNERLHTFSHDLKNRLGGLWEALRLTRELPPGEEQAQVTAFAERSFFGGLRDLENLMDDLQVPRDVVPGAPAPVELGALIAAALAALDFRFAKKQQVVSFPASGPVTVMGDARMLGQLIEALLSNASKFSPKGSSIAVELSLRNDRALINVIDHGVGLSDADLEHVFERYALLTSRSTDGESQARGTLARASNWAKAHGGTLTAESSGPGTGTTFRLALPLTA